MSLLFQSLKIKNVEFKNRIAVSPMCQYSSEDGYANDWHLVHLGSRAVGGAGLIMAEASAVSPEGRITPADLGIWKNEHIENLKRITTFIHQNGSVAGIQLAHAGRKASCSEPWNGGKQISEQVNGWRTLAPSAVPFRETDSLPVELSLEEITRIVQNFKDAALRSLNAGFKVLEIHAAHGYLINTFLSPLSNFRKDEYGGTFENRIRFLCRIIDEVNTVWAENYPLFVRISAIDWAEGGWTIEDSVNLSRILKEKNVDLIDCSSGGLVPYAKIETKPGYQVPFAEAVKTQTGIMSAAVGMITTAEQAETILKNGQADLIFMAREYLREPYFPLSAAHLLGDDVSWPVQYERAKL
ncbi:NADPH dehydrogenase NamA [Daejeonella oryzae]|uniref:NADPH dehydrogenase NamA n=1 Tax=Daejeonella oryzae TaxID=1122943 RepID=UPI0004148B25|nr:NADPH dehydrogenase NamA [Daejeonella oryzae]